MSFAPRDTHEAQVQFALERGVPAMLGVMASQRLPYPARAFDMAHCSRCLIPWKDYGKKKKERHSWYLREHTLTHYILMLKEALIYIYILFFFFRWCVSYRGGSGVAAGRLLDSLGSPDQLGDTLERLATHQGRSRRRARSHRIPSSKPLLEESDSKRKPCYMAKAVEPHRLHQDTASVQDAADVQE